MLLLDEFDAIESADTADTIAAFFPYLQAILYDQEPLHLVPIVGRQPDDMPRLLHLFRQAPKERIGLLEPESARQLIRQPVRDIPEFNYTDEGIEAILALTNHHPYLTQVLCFSLFNRAKTHQRWQVVDRTAVNQIADKAIEHAQAGLAWFQQGLPIPERVFFSAVAEAQAQASDADRNAGQKAVKQPAEVLRFETLFALAKLRLELGNLRKAIALYERAYKVDVLRARDGLAQAYLEYGQERIRRNNFSAAKAVIAKSQQIQPESSEVKDLQKLLQVQRSEVFAKRVSNLLIGPLLIPVSVGVTMFFFAQQDFLKAAIAAVLTCGFVFLADFDQGLTKVLIIWIDMWLNKRDEWLGKRDE